MNANFKPIGLAAAVATAAAGYAGVANAQATLAGNTQLGDLAIVPYYTVLEGYATGINIINTSAQTQVLKFRFRRATDSMDAMDFNVVLSPYDMYTGFISAAGDDITWTSNDNSCVAPAYDTGANKFTMPDIYREDADTGYVEIISMGSPTTELLPIAVSAKHGSDGVPANCAWVRDNFFRGGVAGTTRGVVTSALTVQNYEDAAGNPIMADNTYVASPDSLKVSYFIKSDETGVEFGNNAVHVGTFMDGPAMTNQQTGVFDGDLLGFDHPDLNGGSPIGAGATTGLYESLRTILGAEALINDWSTNSTGEFSVDTDWVVTIPGQYLMVDLPFYQVDLDTDGALPCSSSSYFIDNPSGGPDIQIPACDFRDIPMKATFNVWDREEQGIIVEEGDLVVSPQPPSELIEDVLDKEVNVIQWGAAPVLNAPEFINVPTPDGAKFGWSALAATPSALKTQQICNYIPGVTNPIAEEFGYAIPAMFCTPTTTPAPLIGFAAWQRNFAALPAANYGRIVEHSREQSSS